MGSLESILHSTLLLVTAASMVYAFAKFYRGGVKYHSTTITLGGGWTGPTSRAIHLALGLWAVGAAP